MKHHPNGQLIATIRTDLGLSQAELAKQVGIHRTSLVAIEQGKRMMTVQEATGISQVLKTGVAHIIAKPTLSLYDLIWQLPDSLKPYYCRRALRHKALTEAQVGKLLKKGIVEVREIINQQHFKRLR